jgi:tRNA(fMet)-specific endonuclease VapC
VKFLLDTNAVIALLKGDKTFLKKLQRFSPQDFAISSIVVHELLYGAYKSARVDENVARIQALQIVALDFDLNDAASAGLLRAALAKSGTPIGPYDVLIAGQAIARKLILVTHNTREFSRVPGLKFEDWE